MQFRLLLAVVLVGSVLGDLPVHCLHKDVLGHWLFQTGDAVHNKASIKCSTGKQLYQKESDNFGLGKPNFKPTDKLHVHLQSPNLVTAKDSDGNTHKGSWTMIYDEGFEVRVKDQTFFAYSFFDKGEDGVSQSSCGRTHPGWYHPTSLIDSNKWGCYTGTKLDQIPKPQKFRKFGKKPISMSTMMIEDDKVDFINTHPQSTWKARKYALHERPHTDALGNQIQVDAPFERPEGFVEEQVDVRDIPKEFDWNNVKGHSFVEEVTDQGACGSCYSVSTADMFSSRLRILSKNAKGSAYRASPQSLLSQCGYYAQGCRGGFPYLAAKYGKDIGVTALTKVKYSGDDHKQTTCPKQKQVVARIQDYQYVGGYYGAATENSMLRELYDHGPFVVGIEVAPAMQMYSSGVFHTNVKLPDTDNYERVNHAVLVTGFGEENGQKFWNVKNSWGGDWGDKGYIRVQRGVNCMNIEHMVVAAYPTLTTTLPATNSPKTMSKKDQSQGHMMLQTLTQKARSDTEEISLTGGKIEDPAFLRGLKESLVAQKLDASTDRIVPEHEHRYVE